MIFYAPFDLRGPYRPFCHSCGSVEVNADGWSTFRRVIDRQECIFAICGRYRCTKKHKNACFLSWDAELFEKAPPLVRMAFPVIFTHRLGVTQIVFDYMRSWSEGGSGFGTFADYMRENHTRHDHSKELAYMGRLADLMAEGPLGEVRVAGCSTATASNFTGFSAFSDPDGYGDVHGSKNFYRSVYTRGMRLLEPLMKQRCAMVPARMLSGDHFFKILKCKFKFKGRPLFMAAYSLVNEHTEDMATVLTQTKTLEELRRVHASE